MSTNELNNQLEGIQQALKGAVPLQAYEILRESVENLQASGQASGLEDGELAPDFSLPNAAGRTVQLFEELTKGAVVLMFYRGGWCPFCNLQLRAYQKYLPRFRELEASIIAVSPQSPDNTLSQAEKEGLDFHVLSDADGRVAERYGILYTVSDSLNTVLESFGGSLLEYNATDRRVLPVPAAFVIDRTGKIRFKHVDPDFMRRPEPECVLQALKGLEGKR